MLEDFRYARLVRALNRWAQIALTLSLIGVLNYISFHHFLRKDLTENARYSLSAETLAYIRNLEVPVEFLIAEPPKSRSSVDYQRTAVFKQVRTLLKEFVYASQTRGRNNISLELIDIYRQRDRIGQVAKQYKLKADSEQIMMAVSPLGYQQIHLDELYRQVPGGQIAFTGETAFASALLRISSPEENKIYFTKGHGEMNPHDTRDLRGLSVFKDFLRQRGYRADIVDLTQSERVPQDANLLIVAAPQFSFLGKEQEMINAWLNDEQGRVIFLLEPGYEHDLDDLFYAWGILADDRLILETASEKVTSSGNLLIENFVKHPITELLKEQGLKILMSGMRPVRPHLGAPQDSMLRVQSILNSSSSSWAEKYYQNSPIKFDPIIDIPGPVSVAMVAERSSDSGLGLNIKGGKIVVFGDASWLSNQSFRSGANPLLINETLNWILERKDLLNIPVRAHRQWQLVSDKQTLVRIFLYLLSLSAIVGSFAVVVYLSRRK